MCPSERPRARRLARCPGRQCEGFPTPPCMLHGALRPKLARWTAGVLSEVERRRCAVDVELRAIARSLGVARSSGNTLAERDFTRAMDLAPRVPAAHRAPLVGARIGPVATVASAMRAGLCREARAPTTGFLCNLSAGGLPAYQPPVFHRGGSTTHRAGSSLIPQRSRVASDLSHGSTRANTLRLNSRRNSGLAEASGSPCSSRVFGPRSFILPTRVPACRH